MHNIKEILDLFKQGYGNNYISDVTKCSLSSLDRIKKKYDIVTHKSVENFDCYENNGFLYKKCSCCKKDLELYEHYEFNYSRKRQTHRLYAYCKDCRKNYKKIDRQRKKEYLIKLLGNKCMNCTYNRCIKSLHFHHINPETKRKDVTMLLANHSLYNILPEVKKCILLCGNCHQELHENLINIDDLISKNKELINNYNKEIDILLVKNKDNKEIIPRIHYRIQPLLKIKD